ncbi:MAG: glycosyltransferase [Verrucomicrobiota bacterium]
MRPDFFIVGAPKCGTTAMADYLAGHPEIYMARKEMHFFGADLRFGPQFFRRDLAAYLAEFDAWKGQRHAGEASVWYLFSTRAAAEIRAFSPEARIIIMLREPVEMLHSLYYYFRYDGNEPLPAFEQALAAETDRAGGRGLCRQTYFAQGLAYRQVVRYTEQVRRYFDVFGRERVHVIIYDDFAADAFAAYRQTLGFLCVESKGCDPGFNVINPAKRVRSPALRTAMGDPLMRSAVLALRPWMPRPVFAALQRIDARVRRFNASVERRPPLAPDLRARLKREFAPEVERLSELLGRDLTHWSQDQPSLPEGSALPVWLPTTPTEQPLSCQGIGPQSKGIQTQGPSVECRGNERTTLDPRPSAPGPLLSVIILNYNGAPWLQRCLDSVRRQTLFDQIEIIVADNASPDGSEGLAAGLMAGWRNGRTLQHGSNLGYSEGNNRAALEARGRYLFFLNTDTWLEPHCLERLVQEMQAAGGAAAAPLVMDYMDGAIQSTGSRGFDIFGLLSSKAGRQERGEIFAAEGCSLLIEREWFRKLGGFDDQFFMYADEYDLCWRLWVAGGTVILAPSAEVHHRGAVAVNPRGGERVLEARTSDTKRYYANRNNLLVLLKNSQHLLLALVPLQLLLLGTEALFMWAWTGRWSHIRRAYGEALADCWRLRPHILAERRRLRSLRRHGDFWMLRFLRGRLNRWRELRRFRRFGLPKVDRK